MMNQHAVLFDFDFTLADSTLGAVACVNYALDEMALPRAEPKAIRATIGLGLAATLASLTGLTAPALANTFSRNFVKQADRSMVELTSVFPEVAQTIEQLKNAGIRTGIVSTKFRYRIEKILARDGLLDGFDILVGGEDVANHKPDPEGLLKALDKLGVRTNDSLYIGDHPVDAQAAAAAKIPFAAVLTGTAVRKDFEPWPARMFLDSLRDLMPLLNLDRR
jgi:phosphoglycolate phosphatase